MTKDGLDANDGKSWATAKTSLQAGVDAAAAGGNCQVWVAEGTYVPTWKPDPFGPANAATLNMAANVVVYGGFAGTESSTAQRSISAHPTVITGEIGDPKTTSDNLPVVVTAATGSVLDGVTVTAGLTEGISCTTGTLTLINATVADNAGVGVSMSSTCALRVSASHFSKNAGAISNGSSGALSVDGSDFTSNHLSSSYGGAISQGSYGAVDISNSVFTLNTASQGGAINACVGVTISTPVNITNCTFTSNSVTSGGGAVVVCNRPLTLKNSQFNNNSATGTGSSALSTTGANIIGTTFVGNTGGGSTLSANGTLNIQGSTFRQNVGKSSGAFTASTATVVNTVFDSNSTTGDAAAIDVRYTDSTLRVVNCLFMNNSTKGSGGAIRNAGTVTVANSTFFGNSAGTGTTNYGGAIYNSSGALTLTNSILWGDKAGTGPEVYDAVGVTLTMQNCDVQGAGFTGTNGNISVDPQFVSTTAGALNLQLQSGSPCVNTGANALLPPDWLDVNNNGNTTELLPLDLDGKPRVVNTLVDMGPYESSY